MPARRRLWRLLTCFCPAAIVMAAVLPGCRKTAAPGPSAGTGGAGPGGTSPGGGDATPVPGSLEVRVFDGRLRQYATNYFDFDYTSYTETVVNPGQEVLVGQGYILLTLVWTQPVTLESIRPFLLFEPAPDPQWNWLQNWPDEHSGSCLQVRYPAESPVPMAAVCFGAGLPLGGGKPWPTTSLSPYAAAGRSRSRPPSRACPGIPGTICLAEQDPLVLAGMAPVALTCLDSPGDPAAQVRIIPLEFPLRAGRIAPQGNRALLWEAIPDFDISGEGPDELFLPWTVDLAGGAAGPVDEAFSGAGDRFVRGMSGWSADGRLVLPDSDRTVAVSWTASPPTAVVWPGWNDLVRTLAGELLGWTGDGKLWMVTPVSAGW